MIYIKIFKFLFSILKDILFCIGTFLGVLLALGIIGLISLFIALFLTAIIVLIINYKIYLILIPIIIVGLFILYKEDIINYFKDKWDGIK